MSKVITRFTIPLTLPKNFIGSLRLILMSLNLKPGKTRNKKSLVNQICLNLQLHALFAQAKSCKFHFLSWLF